MMSKDEVIETLNEKLVELAVMKNEIRHNDLDYIRRTGKNKLATWIIAAKESLSDSIKKNYLSEFSKFRIRKDRSLQIYTDYSLYETIDDVTNYINILIQELNKNPHLVLVPNSNYASKTVAHKKSPIELIDEFIKELQLIEDQTKIPEIDSFVSKLVVFVEKSFGDQCKHLEEIRKANIHNDWINEKRKLIGRLEAMKFEVTNYGSNDLNQIDINSKIVLVVDMIQSTELISKFREKSDINVLIKLIEEMNAELKAIEKTGKLNLYKFTGDGWILLLNESILGEELHNMIKLIATKYNDKINAYIHDRLETPVKPLGLKITVDHGEVFQLLNSEYIGRPINLACRLQTLATPVNKSKRSYVVVMSNRIFQDYYKSLLDEKACISNCKVKLINMKQGLKGINRNEPYIAQRIYITASIVEKEQND